MTKYAFFYENTYHTLAESDEEKNYLSKFNIDAVVKELTDTQFNNAKNLKTSLSLEGETVQETAFYSEDTPLLNDAEVDPTTAKEQIQSLIDNLFKPKLEMYLGVDLNKDNEDYSYWLDYNNKINQVSVDSMSFPLSVETFQEWFNSQSGYPTKSILQLP
tara:strand:+ start:117 stop:596 length:480 start_codon:yes stop_codon:yes gene_type:complete